MRCVWLLIGCGFLPKLGGSWRGEITLTVVVDRDGGGSSLHRKHSFKEYKMQDNVGLPSCR